MELLVLIVFIAIALPLISLVLSLILFPITYINSKLTKHDDDGTPQ